jgi:ATP-dependent DNA helicase RecG
MVTIYSLDDLQWLSESVELECKLAIGQDGRGKLPESFWETYSAFANTHGGVVILGVKEKHGVFEPKGVPDAEKVLKELFDNLNNPKKVSHNLILDKDIQRLPIGEAEIIIIDIPRATRHQKPIFLNANPFGGNTYRRLHEGDRRCDDETIKRMLAEQVEDVRDNKILDGYNLDDIDLESLRIYRQMLRDRNSTHPFLDYEGLEFLRQLNGWRQDRQTKEVGLTVAGLLMFGKWPSIQEAMPHYFVDYQERPEAKTEKRWVDRIVPDGTWSGNLFDFYRKVYRKLIADLKTPFELKGDQRREDTPVHEALREALVNTIVHADYSGRISILVVKRPDMFGFRNPGNLRLPIEQVVQGGESDCRNRLMHQMFLMIGLGERAGSGVPKIFGGWKSQEWRPPFLYEKDEPEQTLLELRMIDLYPTEVIEILRRMFGKNFDSLNQLERTAMITAVLENVVTHNRLLELVSDHAHDISMALQKLVKNGFLESSGKSRGTVYVLPGVQLPTPDDVFTHNLPQRLGISEGSLGISEGSLGISEGSLGISDAVRDEKGRLVSDHLDAPVIDDVRYIDPEYLKLLLSMTEETTDGRLPKQVMRRIILHICSGQYIPLSILAYFLNRSPDALRKQHLTEMVRDRQLVLAFPATPTHEKQAYKATDIK